MTCPCIWGSFGTILDHSKVKTPPKCNYSERRKALAHSNLSSTSFFLVAVVARTSIFITEEVKSVFSGFSCSGRPFLQPCRVSLSLLHLVPPLKPHLRHLSLGWPVLAVLRPYAHGHSQHRVQQRPSGKGWQNKHNPHPYQRPP